MKMEDYETMINKVDKGFDLVTKTRNLWLHLEATPHVTTPPITYSR